MTNRNLVFAVALAAVLVAKSEEVVWIDGADLPLEGRGFADVAQRWEPFARAVRAAHPDVLIVFMEPCHESHQRDKQKACEVIRACYEKLRREDPKLWDRLYLLRADDQLPGDDETTVEGVHPNDWGMMHVGRALGELLKRIGVGDGHQEEAPRPKVTLKFTDEVAGQSKCNYR